MLTEVQKAYGATWKGLAPCRGKLSRQELERSNAYAREEERHSDSDNSSVTLLVGVIAPLVLSAAAIARISYDYKDQKDGMWNKANSTQ